MRKVSFDIRERIIVFAGAMTWGLTIGGNLGGHLVGILSSGLLSFGIFYFIITDAIDHPEKCSLTNNRF